MSIPVLILGESGSGKSYSIRNLDPEKTVIVKTLEKRLPFRGEAKFTASVVSTLMAKIVQVINSAAEKGKTAVVVDDFQYFLAFSYMNRSGETGFQKFTDMAKEYWSIIMTAAAAASPDMVVFFLSHVEETADGKTKSKTIGKLLDEKITVEGLFTIVLQTASSDGVFSFMTTTNGRNTVKSPVGMFTSEKIDNDLELVRSSIISYYNEPETTAK